MEAMSVREELLGNTPWYAQLISDQMIMRAFLPFKKTLQTVDQSRLFTCTINSVVQ